MKPKTKRKSLLLFFLSLLIASGGALFALPCSAASAKREGTRKCYQAEWGILSKGARWGVGQGAQGLLLVKGLGTDGAEKENGALTFPLIYLKQAGLYRLTLEYRSGENDRRLDLQINKGVQTQVPCPGRDWGKNSQTSLLVYLKKGWNNLRFSCDGWYAPHLDAFTISDAGKVYGPLPDLRGGTPETIAMEGLMLTLNTQNGAVGLAAEGRTLLKDMLAAAALGGKRVLSYDYAAHKISRDGEDVIFTHTGNGLPEMIQRFRYAEGGLFIDLEMRSAGTIQTNWMAPLLGGANSLQGGTEFLKVPYDNDDFAGYSLLNANCVDVSSEVTALIDRKSGGAVVVGSAAHDTWKSGMFWAAEGGSVKQFCAFGGYTAPETRDAGEHGIVKGATLRAPTIFVKYDADWREALNAYGAANAAIAPQLPWGGGAPMGWNSWGTVQFDVNREIIDGVAEYIHNELQPVWPEGNIYINLDSGWGRALPNLEAQREFVAQCAARGQKVGVYTTPFALWMEAKDLKGRTRRDAAGNEYPLEELVLHDSAGNILSAWDGALALDPTHPAVIDGVTKGIQEYVQAGFAYLKLDFMSHGAREGVHYAPNITTGIQAYNFGMRKILEASQGKLFLNLSIAPIFPYQYTHGRRMACDTFSRINETEYMLNSLTFGFWQQALYACPDPDHIVSWGKDGKPSLGEARARVTSGAIAASFLTGDAFRWPAEENDGKAKERYDAVYRNADIMALAGRRVIFQPGELPAAGFHPAARVYMQRAGNMAYAAVFNFGNSAADVTINPEEIAGAQRQSYNMKALWSNETFEADDQFTAHVAGQDAEIYVIERWR